MKTSIFILASACALLLASCESTSFRSSGGSKKKAPPPAPQAERPMFDPQAFGDAMPEKNSAGMQVETFPLASSTQANPIDIIFVVDTSGSMREEKALLEQKMAFFIQNLTINQNTDYKIYMIGENFNFPTTYDLQRFVTINRYVGSYDALTALADFITGRLGVFSRPGATKHAVIITDDNAAGRAQAPPPGMNSPFGLPFIIGIANSRGINAQQFKSQVGFGLQQSKLHVHGFVGQRAGRNNSWCNIDGVGTEYMALANDPMFQGRIQDLCNSDWNSLLGNLASNIIELNQPTSHRLLQQIDSTRPIMVQVNGIPVSPAAYSINESNNSITIISSQNFPQNSLVRVEYYPSNG